MKIYIYVPLHFVIKHHYITVDLVENSTSVIDDFCVVSHVPVTVSVRPLRYLTWGNAFYHIFEVGGRRPPCVTRRFNHWLTLLSGGQSSRWQYPSRLGVVCNCMASGLWLAVLFTMSCFSRVDGHRSIGWKTISLVGILVAMCTVRLHTICPSHVD